MSLSISIVWSFRSLPSSLFNQCQNFYAYHLMGLAASKYSIFDYRWSKRISWCLPCPWTNKIYYGASTSPSWSLAPASTCSSSGPCWAAKICVQMPEIPSFWPSVFPTFSFAISPVLWHFGRWWLEGGPLEKVWKSCANFSKRPKIFPLLCRPSVSEPLLVIDTVSLCRPHRPKWLLNR